MTRPANQTEPASRAAPGHLFAGPLAVNWSAVAREGWERECDGLDSLQKALCVPASPPERSGAARSRKPDAVGKSPTEFPQVEPLDMEQARTSKNR